jgi:hypothetical protein
MHRPSVKYIRITNDIPPAYILCVEKYMIDHSYSLKMQIESFFQIKTSVANPRYMTNALQKEKR